MFCHSSGKLKCVHICYSKGAVTLESLAGNGAKGSSHIRDFCIEKLFVKDTLKRKINRYLLRDLSNLNFYSYLNPSQVIQYILSLFKECF